MNPRPQGTATVTHMPGAVILDPTKFNLIVYLGPSKKFWLEDGSASVADVLRAAEGIAGTAANINALATQFGTDAEHVLQAIEFGRHAIDLTS